MTRVILEVHQPGLQQGGGGWGGGVCVSVYVCGGGGGSGIYEYVSGGKVI